MALPYPLNPLGISVRENLPLTFSAVEASTVKLTATGSPTVSGLHYRLGTSGPWIAYTIGTEIPLSAGKKVQFWNTNSSLSLSSANYATFAMTGKIIASGNVWSLLNWTTALSTSCFRNLFNGCESLTEPPELPPLPYTTQCFFGMFRQSGIKHPPALFSTQLATSCLEAAFFNCLSLTEIPRIPDRLALRSCAQTFRGCTAITEAVLDFTTLADSAVLQMFQDCSNLSRIEVSFTQWGAIATIFSNWVLRVSATGTFIKPAALPEEFGTNRIPTGWTVINK